MPTTAKSGFELLLSCLIHYIRLPHSVELPSLHANENHDLNPIKLCPPIVLALKCTSVDEPYLNLPAVDQL